MDEVRDESDRRREEVESAGSKKEEQESEKSEGKHDILKGPKLTPSHGRGPTVFNNGSGTPPDVSRSIPPFLLEIGTIDSFVTLISLVLIKQCIL